MAVKAVEIAPAAYAAGNDSLVEKFDDLEYDLGNLMASDTHPYVCEHKDSEKELEMHCRENCQLLVNAIFNLDTMQSDLGLLAKLPTPSYVLPREKPVPKAKVPTRWEVFAKEKGIVKSKKTRMVFDEEKEEYNPRWGYKRGNEDLKDWAVEVKDNEDIYQDPWTKRKEEKKKRVDKNVRQQNNNMKQGRGDREKAVMPNGIPAELNKDKDGADGKKGKEGTKATLEKVQFSTASMGKFDTKRTNEPERKQKHIRTAHEPVVGKETQERERSLTVLNRILGSNEADAKRKATEDVDDTHHVKKKRGKKNKNITKGHAKRGGRK